jgi:hypothetical protein
LYNDAVPHDEALVERMREVLADHPGVRERRMFGGLSFLVNGNMACGVTGDSLVVRVGPAGYATALSETHCRECDFTGRPLKGIVMVDPKGYASEGDLRAWVERGYGFASSLPAK